MDNQTKIDVLRASIRRIQAYKRLLGSNFTGEDAVDTNIQDLQSWLQELEQSNNKDWTNEQLYTHCKDNNLLGNIHHSILFGSNGREVMLDLIDKSNNKDNIGNLVDDSPSELVKEYSRKLNIDNWTNRELFDYCIEYELLNKFDLEFNTYNNIQGRKLMINIISQLSSY